MVDLAGGHEWKHGWIPLTPGAALQKAHGSHKGADKLLAKHNPREAEHAKALERRNNAHVVARTRPNPSSADFTEAAAQFKRENPGKKIAGNEREVERIANELWRKKRLKGPDTGPTETQKAAEKARIKASVASSQNTIKRLHAEKTGKGAKLAAVTHVHVFDLAGVCTGPGPCDTTSRDRSPKQNWVDKAGGMPAYIKAIRNALLRKGHSMPRATALAVGTAKNWASGKGNVSAATRARAAKAVAEWEAMKGRAHSMSVPSQRAVDLAAKKPKAPASDPKVKAAQDAQQQQIQGGSGDFNSKHPRAGKGTATGGQFISAGSGGDQASPEETQQIMGVEREIGVEADGVFDDKDAAALAAWQKKQGLQVDGAAGAQTLSRMADGPDVGPGALRAEDKAFAFRRGSAEESNLARRQRAEGRGKTQNARLSAGRIRSVDLANRPGAMPGDRFPAASAQQLKKAVRAYGRAKPGDKPKVKRHIVSQAKKLGATHMLPDSWKG